MEVSVTVAGLLEDFEGEQGAARLAAFGGAMAEAAKVSADRVTVVVAPGSVHLSALISPDTSADGASVESVRASLSKSLAGGLQPMLRTLGPGHEL